MTLNSKELTIIFIEILIALSIMVLSYFFKDIKFSSIIIWILLIAGIIVLVTIIFGIIYQRIKEIVKTLEKDDTEQESLKEKLKRTEDLIDIRADIKELKRMCKQNGKNN